MKLYLNKYLSYFICNKRKNKYDYTSIYIIRYYEFILLTNYKLLTYDFKPTYKYLYLKYKHMYIICGITLDYRKGYINITYCYKKNNWWSSDDKNYYIDKKEDIDELINDISNHYINFPNISISL